jgi:hypothetical protein
MNEFPLDIFYFLFNLILFLLSGIILVLRIRRWKVSYPFINLIKEFLKEKRLGMFAKLKIIINTFVHELLFLRRAGFLCEENFHFYGRVFLVYGFGGMVIMNFVNHVLNPKGYRFGFFHPLSILSYLAYAAMSIGALMLLLRRLIRINLRKTTDISVWLMHSLLLYFGIIGILFFTSINAGYILLSSILFYFYLAGISLLYLYLPLSEVGYFIWKGSSLLTHVLRSEYREI